MAKAPNPKEAPTGSRRQPFGPETIQALQELGDVFRQIHRRLISEGYTIRDGKIIKPGADNTNNGANPQK